MLSHELAHLLLKQRNIQIMIPKVNESHAAELIENVSIINNEGVDEPFNEYIFLEGQLALSKEEEITII
jgi:hypothetical protein